MSQASDGSAGGNGFWSWLRGLFKPRNGDSKLRDTIEEIIEEIEESEGEEEAATPIGTHERVMLSNILKLRHLTAYDVMVPRADIVAVEEQTGYEEVLQLMAEGGHSRVPVYRGTLDEVLGFVHIKDLLTFSGAKSRFKLNKILRPLIAASPSIRVMDLLLEMRLKRMHMALVVDEFGGIDGLITIEDLVEEIVGEIEDEHDVAEGPKLQVRADGTMLADARMEIEEFENAYGQLLSEEEREEDIDTLGGLVFTLAGRVPARGELIEHPASGLAFEVVQADPRRIKRLRIRKSQLPAPDAKAARGKTKSTGKIGRSGRA
ncbi:MAG: hemolysin family protein [Rhodovibrionaceae bacterium]